MLYGDYFLILILISSITVIRGGFQLWYERDCMKGKALNGSILNTFKEFPNPNPGACFTKCAHDCRCESFQFVKNAENNSLCQLNGYPFENSTETMVEMEDFIFCNMTNERSSKGCSPCDEGCCNSKANPCTLAGGRCIVGCNSRPRYKCVCDDGEVGTKCTPRPKSCRDVLRFDPSAKSGRYTIHLASDRHITTQVFCDIYYDEAWTLVESFRRIDQSTFDVPFYRDYKQESAGDMLSGFRLSLQWMKSIKSHSTKWRATCNYTPQVQLDRIDLVVTTFKKIDLLSAELKPGCHEVNYININKYQCHDCTTWFSQRANESAHFSPKYGEMHGCFYRGPPDFPVESRAFGSSATFYSSFRCTDGMFSTTAFWFGG